MADRYGRRYRSRADTTEMEDTPTIRLLDIPTNTQFHDLLDLVRVFHSLKIKLPRDQDYPDGSRNRGFAFITFSSHEDAERAKDALDGHAYGTNILHAEWSRKYASLIEISAEVKLPSPFLNIMPSTKQVFRHSWIYMFLTRFEQAKK